MFSVKRTMSARLLCGLMLIVATTLNINATDAQSGRTAQSADQKAEKPMLIVWAKTELEGGGQPTLDLVDLERYFAKQLTEYGVENMAPSATAHMPKAPAQNIYLVELSVEAMQHATRAKQDETTKAYKDEYFFCVELSASVKNLASGQPLGSMTERYEHQFVSNDGSQKLTAKRAGIYAAADRLADEFAGAMGGGKFGSALREIRPSHVRAWHVLVGIGGLLIVMIIVGALVGEPPQRTGDVPRPAAVPAKPPTPPERNPAYDSKLEEAQTLAQETEGFTEYACRDRAAINPEEILSMAAKVEAAEAKRRLNLKKRLEENEKIAEYATHFCFMDKTSIFDMLCKAEELPFLVLQHAKRIVNEGRATTSA